MRETFSTGVARCKTIAADDLEKSARNRRNFRDRADSQPVQSPGGQLLPTIERGDSVDSKRIETLVALCRTRDKYAPTDLWSEVSDLVYRWILKKFPNLPESDAEVVAAHAFAEAILKLQTFEGHSTFRTWLCGIARHLAVDELRRRGVRDVMESVETMPEEVLFRRARPADRRSCEDHMNEVLRELRLEVSALQMEVVLLRLRSRLDNAEIAARMGTTVGAVKNLWWRTAPRLIRLLEVRGQRLDLVTILGAGH